MARKLPDLIQTERLVLREPLESDAAAIFEAYTQDAQVSRYMIWRPHTVLSETEAFVAGCIQGWASGLRQPYVLALSGDPERAIGMLEARPLSHIVDIGYVLARGLWGRGLMPEAIRALASRSLSMPSFFRVQATCDVENHASARTLEKSGFSREARLERYTVHPNISSEPRACFMYALCR